MCLSEVAVRFREVWKRGRGQTSVSIVSTTGSRLSGSSSQKRECEEMKLYMQGRKHWLRDER